MNYLSDPALSPSSIAAALHVSMRQVHALFSASGTSVSAFVRTRRLESAKRDLVDPTLAHLGIADHAARWGFADGPHFTRSFENAYGLTPIEFRRTNATACGS